MELANHGGLQIWDTREVSCHLVALCNLERSVRGIWDRLRRFVQSRRHFSWHGHCAVAAAWMLIVVLFAQEFEHTVVNMFVIPAGMMLGAKVSISDFVIWNLIPVTIGNLVGGFSLVALALFSTFARKPREAGPSALPRHAES
jgi:hypothetical protein